MMPGDENSLPLTFVDQVCGRFESACRQAGTTGPLPALEEYLVKELQSGGFAKLLRELLKLEWAYRQRRGEKPTKEEYLKRFSNNQSEVEAAWQEMVSLVIVQPGFASPDVKPPAPKFPDGYELLEEVARGGMGVVYRVRQTKLNREVALKMILGGGLADPEYLVRFRTEAEVAAKLKHPNIVGVHEFGDVDGNPFFTMEFIHGRSLAQRLAQGSLPSKAAARYLLQISRAIHYAHNQGILHRDLKPSNVLIDAQDEVHITDFGLAKRLNDDTGQTLTGRDSGHSQLHGSRTSPGKIHDLGPACDIYGMGAILYELLTGRPPFKAETPFDTVMQVLHNDPVPPRLLNPKVDSDLETICLKCLEKDPRYRYVSAEALADDLQKFLDGDSISAHSSGVMDRLMRTLQHGHHDAAFHTWSTMLFSMAAVVFVVHLAEFISQSRWLVLTAQSAQFMLLAYLFWRNRRARLLPSNAAERELWSIWIGFFLAYACSKAAFWAMPIFGLIKEGRARALRQLDTLSCIPVDNYYRRVGVLQHGQQLLGPLLRHWSVFFHCGLAHAAPNRMGRAGVWPCLGPCPGFPGCAPATPGTSGQGRWGLDARGQEISGCHASCQTSYPRPAVTTPELRITPYSIGCDCRRVIGQCYFS